MPTVRWSPVGNGVNWIPNTGLIANGYKLYFYAANTSTKQDTYTTEAGTVANANPVVLDSYGFPSSGGNRVQIWLQDGLEYKVVIASGSDTDPPASGITLADYLTGVNDASETPNEQWVASGYTPTYVSGTSFTVATDVTATLHVGRRLKSTNTGGTIYSTITASSYGAPNTTITVTNDSSSLDSGLSAVWYSFLTSTNPAVPKVALPDGSTATTQAATDSSTKIATTAFVATNATTNKDNAICDFRLTLTSGTPVTTSDVTGATTVYCTPYKGNKIGLYNGSTWDVLTSAEFSVALGTITSDQCYDVFCYNNNGTATLEILAWTNNTTRATALVRQDGILCKTGALTRRYLGTFLTTSTTTTEDSIAKRYLWNFYHRSPRKMQVIEATASWAYTTTSWRQANNAAANQLNYVIGVVEDTVQASALAVSDTSAGTNTTSTAIGNNSTSTPTGLVGIAYGDSSGGGSIKQSIRTDNNIIPSTVGKNYAAWLEYGAANATFFGTTGVVLAGITGVVLA